MVALVASVVVVTAFLLELLMLAVVMVGTVAAEMMTELRLVQMPAKGVV